MTSDNALLTMEMRDFGPIKEGKLDLKPLTVLIGPNNSGKSYTALLLRAIFETLQSGPIHRAFFQQVYQTSKGRKSQQLTESSMLESIIAVFRSTNTRTALSRQFREELLGTFGVERMTDLIRSGQKNALISIESKAVMMKIDLDGRSSRFEVELKEPNFTNLASNSLKKHLPKLERRGARMDARLTHEVMVNAVIDVLRSWLSFHELYYLPAARSGIAQSYRVIIASLVSEAPYLALRGIKLPRLSSPIADFISRILIWGEYRGALGYNPRKPLARVAHEFEKRALRGDITLRRIKENELPEIVYKFGGKELNLLQASSSIGELAPVLISLKYGFVRKDSIVVLEEPEAHLHPGWVIEMARLIGGVLNENVNLLITTHNDFLLSSINLLIKAHLAVDKGKAAGGTIDPNKVKAYLFKGRPGESTVEELEITKEGMPLDEFNKVVDELQDRHISLLAK